MRPHTYPIAAGMLAAATLASGFTTAQTASAAAGPNRTERISISSLGEPNDISSRSSRPALSASGSVIAYDSIATNLVQGDTNLLGDVFVRDRATRRTQRVSVGDSGQQANGDSTRADISADGRLVAFESVANNLLPGDINATPDVFVRDRVSRRTTVVSQAANGTWGNAASITPDISADGRFVVFASDASNLLSGPVPEAVRNIYLKDLRSGRVELVSRSVTGRPITNAASPVVSANGRFVAFSSFASDVVAGDTNDQVDVFVRDRLLGRTTRVSVNSAGVQGEGGFSAFAAISADGQLVAFLSDATNLVGGDTNAGSDVFVHDSRSGATTRASVGPGGVQANEGVGFGIRGGLVFGPDISADGRYVTFNSPAANLVVGDTNTCTFRIGQSFPLPGQCPDIFVRDRRLRTTVRVSVSSAGAQANDASTDPAISADGRSVAFLSTASNLASGDTNVCGLMFSGHPGQCPDVYVHDR